MTEMTENWSVDSSRLTGGCSCGAVRYRITGEPFTVQACHCGDCKRTTGSAFVVHIVILRSDLDLIGETRMGLGPSGSGEGCELHACVECGVIIWAHYRFNTLPVIVVRAGTLDDPSAVSPRAHIFVGQKAPWIDLPEDVLQFAESANRAQTWPEESQKRYDALLASAEGT